MQSFVGAAVFLMAQLLAPGGGLPQIVQPEFKAAAMRVGQKATVTVSFGVRDGYLINRTPPMKLKLTPVDGMALAKTELETSAGDPKSSDQYYVDMPVLKVPVEAEKVGDYEISGKLVYFFCSKADGFCSRQVLDVKIALSVK